MMGHITYMLWYIPVMLAGMMLIFLSCPFLRPLLLVNSCSQQPHFPGSSRGKATDCKFVTQALQCKDDSQHHTCAPCLVWFLAVS